MPTAGEAYIELICSVPLTGFMASLSYNVLLVVFCTYYAFKTRALPDNFNESRYVTFCVYTTLVIWLVFIPSYFTTLRFYQQTIVLSSALLLNATVTLICLFTPKVYALYCGRHLGAPATAACAAPASTGFKYNMDSAQKKRSSDAAAPGSTNGVSRSVPTYADQ